MNCDIQKLLNLIEQFLLVKENHGPCFLPKPGHFFSYEAITKAGNDLSLLVILQKILSKDFIIKP